MTTEQGVEVRRLACEAWGRHGEGANMRLEDTKGSYAFVDDDCAVHCSFSERARLTEPSRTSLPSAREHIMTVERRRRRVAGERCRRRPMRSVSCHDSLQLALVVSRLL
jgi:hypothetical protein